MKKIWVTILCIMVAFNISFVSVFSFVSDTSVALGNAISLVNTFIPGANFTSYPPSNSYFRDDDGFFQFVDLDKYVMLPSIGLNWNSTLTSQNVQDWIDVNVIPYSYTPEGEYSYTFPTFNLVYSMISDGDSGIGIPLVSEVELYPNIYTGYIYYDTFPSPPPEYTFDEIVSNTLVSFVRLKITYYTPNNAGYKGSILNNLLWSQVPQLSLLSTGKDYNTIEVLCPIDQRLQVLYLPEGASSPYRSYIYFCIRSFGYDIALTTNPEVSYPFPFNSLSVWSLTDTGTDIITYLENYKSSYRGGR